MVTLGRVFDEIERLRAELAARHVERIGVFGSVARGDAHDASDVDLLVELSDQGDLFDLAGIRTLLADALGCAVDVVPAGGLKPDVRERILREVRYAA